jgi:hypothetical protein
MRSTPRYFFSFVLLTATSLDARAETRILAGNDKDAVAILAAVTEFKAAVADGNSDAARALFAGDAEHTAIVSAFLDWTNSAEHLRKGLEEKYDPANFPKVLLISKGLHAQLEGMKNRIVVVNGDRASISPAGVLDRGMRLRLVDGKWKVTHMTGRPIDAKPYGQLLRGVAGKYQAAEADYTSGKLKSLEDVLERLLILDDSERKGLLATSQLQQPMPVEQLPRPAKWQPPAPDLLLKLLVTPAPSDDITRLYSSLPGIPFVSGTEEFFSVFDDEAGIEITQELKPTRRLFSINFYARGVHGCAQYQGQLPHGPSFADTRADVERKLGRPPIIRGGASDAPIYAVYPTLGLTVEYTRPAGSDPLNTISQIAALQPDPKGDPIPVTAGPTPRVALRLVATDPSAKDVDLIVDPSNIVRGGIPVSRKVEIDESGIAVIYCVFATKPTETARLGIQMNDEGARQFKAITTKNNGRTLALMFDGRLIVTARINGPLPGSIALGLPNSPSTSEIVQLAGHMNAAVQALPEAPPAKSQ